MDPMDTVTDLSCAMWRKSSYSGGSNSNCVEVTSVSLWRKSSYSGGNGSNCVEVGGASQAILVRDSKNLDAPSLLVSPRGWSDFTAQLKSRRT